MKFLGLATVALALTASAFATSVTELCGVFGATAGTSFFSTVGLIPGDSGTVTCAGFSAVPLGSTFSNVTIVLQSDFTGGLGTTTNTISTIFGVTKVDTLTSTSSPGQGGSETYSSANIGAPNAPSFGNNYFSEVTGLTQAQSLSSFNESYAVSLTSGSVQGTSGQVYAILNYTSSVPEPMTFSLMGAGLLGLGLLRKRIARG